jgi:hypothetical protein
MTNVGCSITIEASSDQPHSTPTTQARNSSELILVTASFDTAIPDPIWGTNDGIVRRHVQARRPKRGGKVALDKRNPKRRQN